MVISPLKGVATWTLGSHRAGMVVLRQSESPYFGPIHPNVRMIEEMIHDRPGLRIFENRPPDVGRAVIYVGVSHFTGKMYVGKHERGTEGLSVRTARWKRHEANKSQCTAIGSACQKYAVHWFVVDEIDAEDEVETEAAWIKDLGTMSPEGYNLKDPRTLAFSEETRLKISMSTKATLQPRMQKFKATIQRRQECKLSSMSTEQAVAQEKKFEANRRGHIRKVAPETAPSTAELLAGTIEERRKRKVDELGERDGSRWLHKQTVKSDWRSGIKRTPAQKSQRIKDTWNQKPAEERNAMAERRRQTILAKRTQKLASMTDEEASAWIKKNDAQNRRYIERKKKKALVES